MSLHEILAALLVVALLALLPSVLRYRAKRRRETAQAWRRHCDRILESQLHSYLPWTDSLDEVRRAEQEELERIYRMDGR